jgi:nitric oxide reductase NorE protein
MAVGPSISRSVRTPGETGIWVLVAGDLLLFSVFFILLLTYRAEEPALFSSSQRSLDQFVGALNTLLLLTSSLFMALAVKSVRSGTPSARSAPRLIAAAALLGLGFVIVKAFEWSARFAAGQTISSNDFFMFYFMYTGIHLLHVLLGLIVLTLLFLVSRRPSPDAHAVRLVESGGIFWHLVDLLWVVLFALFYLLR